MPKLLIAFLILSSIAAFFLGCASAKIATQFDAKWEFIDIPGSPTRACLFEADAMKLREILIRCEAKK